MTVAGGAGVRMLICVPPWVENQIVNMFLLQLGTVDKRECRNCIVDNLHITSTTPEPSLTEPQTPITGYYRGK